MSSAVDLVQGLGVLTGIEVVDVPGATAGFDNDYGAQARACIGSLADRDLFVLHIEATDEAGHQGRSDIKVDALERWDADVIGPVLDALDARRRALPDPADARPRDALRHQDAQRRAGAVPPLRLDPRRIGWSLHGARDRAVRSRARAFAHGPARRRLNPSEGTSGERDERSGIESGPSVRSELRPRAAVGYRVVFPRDHARERFSAVGAGSPHFPSVLGMLGEIVRDLPRTTTAVGISWRVGTLETRITRSHSGRCRQGHSRSVGAGHE